MQAAVIEQTPYIMLPDDECEARIAEAKRALGERLVILGHHYQQDEVIELADLRGDSYQLSKEAAQSSDCHHIVFCGVHFMAETADILANRPEKVAERDGRRVTVVLPDLVPGAMCGTGVMQATGGLGQRALALRGLPMALAIASTGR